ncbi:conjugative transposon protein TraJ [Mucilaginibacter sp. L3T2-6]|uniref:conjugative transposon protein TraJ n=1 Tax=Mucilaginibacter sp. L3T2-6 TaxID=3062491 RepID=UPI002676AFAF|nr:conjugative transposon protein TraJ [Mucilaginibacter sp. L3T2-6]MDO3641516.1 conjugative transposon protein TraJ [Mucilaginibacter sp. L3T2-6]MDV6213723.1 conjugative transposon protein TraJ [Mucilaginibacter sp. L3T2-6]
MKIKQLINSAPFKGAAGLLLLLLLPHLSKADGLAGDLQGMQPVLDNVYSQMLPLCSKLIDAARGIAGFASLSYIAPRVWRQIANAEPLEFYPLLRPFALGMAILLFPAVIALMNGVLQPVVGATANMVQDSNTAIAKLLKQKEDAVKNSSAYQMYVGTDGNGDQDKWYKYTHPDDPNGDNQGVFDGIGNDVKFWLDKQSYNFRNSIKQWMSEVLEVVYAAASLCINTIRTFFLIVLAILGPLVFGLSVFDGFQHSLHQWLARYINIFLWLPIANIFGSIIGKVQENMLKLDISQIQSSGDTFFSSTDTAYLIFLLIGIVGYFSVPTVANFIVHAHGGNGMLQRVTSIAAGGISVATNTATGAGSTAASVAPGLASRAARGAGNILNAPRNYWEGYHSAGNSNYQKDKLSGKS